MTPPKALHWTIKKFENGCAILQEGGRELSVPRAQLPEKAKEGDVVTAEFYLVKDEKLRKENLARFLLDEILGKE